MKSLNFIATLLILLLSASCTISDPAISSDPKNGFCLTIGDSIVYTANQIDYYDSSAHLLYLKGGNSFSYSKSGSFSVYADGIKIYTGQMWPSYSSYLPKGPVIPCAPSFYDSNIIPINLISITEVGKVTEDPRGDVRIVNALKKYNQYREGLSGEIVSIKKTSAKNIQLTLRLTNYSSVNLYYLNPDNTGINLFHYFTNGLILRNSQNKLFKNNISIQEPPTWNDWKLNWLSVIFSKESKTITLNYSNFDSLPSGQYTAGFSFPGLKSQVKKSDLKQKSGFIWLGELPLTKSIQIN